jgi:hypothetical protein
MRVTSGLLYTLDRHTTTGWQRLLEYKWGALVKERGTGKYFEYRQVRHMHITANGRALYHDQWVRYRELYPDVETPEPMVGAAS